MEELHCVGDDLWAVAGDGVVLAFDDLQGGGGAVCLQVAFAAPKGHDVVAVAVLQQHHRTAAGGGVEPFGQRHLIGNIAFRTVNEDFLRATGRQ